MSSTSERRRGSAVRRTLPLVLGGLLSAAAGSSAVLTVGDDEPADFDSLQAAIAAAGATGGFSDVRVAVGTYVENVRIASRFEGALHVSGGWDPSFSLRNVDPDLTVLRNERDDGRPLEISCATGAFRFEGFTFTGGRALVQGGGVRLLVSDSCVVDLVGNVVASNSVYDEPGGFGYGGGVWGVAQDGGRLRLSGNLVADNSMATTESGQGSGAYLVARDEGSLVELVDSELSRNEVTAQHGRHSSGSALHVEAIFGAIAIVLDTVLHDNRYTLEGGAATTPGSAVGAVFFMGGRCDADSSTTDCPYSSLQVHRTRISKNRVDVANASEVHQVYLAASGGTFRFSDSIVAAGNGSGLKVQTLVPALVSDYDPPLLQLSNLTVANHEGVGLAIQLSPSRTALAYGTVSVYNSISARNREQLEVVADDSGVMLDPGSNLIGGDPRFVADGTYDLRADSPAIDGGNDSPPGGLGVWDVYRRDRVVGARVDIGATERQGEGPDPGAGACRIVDPFRLPDFVPACRCFTDSIRRELRCGFFLHDLFVDVNVALEGPRSKPFEVSWHLLPWSGIEGAYELAAALLNEQGKEIQRFDVRTQPPKLQDGFLASGNLARESAEGLPSGTTLRTRVRYQSADGKPVEFALDLALPEQAPP